MTFTKFDFFITLGFLLFIILLSFVAPAIGLSSDNVSNSDIPDYNVSSSEFDFVGELPEFPVQPTSGILNHSSDKFDNFRGDIQFELGPGNNGNRIFLVAIDNDTVHLTDVEDNTINDTHTFTSNDETHELNAYGYTVDVHSIDISENAGKYEWKATDRPQDSDLPLIGGIADFSDKLVSVVGWFVSTIAVAITIGIEGLFNAGVLIFDIAIFFLALMNFIFTTYLSVFNGVSSGFAKVILTIPLAAISIQFSRVAIILLKRAPGFS